MSFSDFRVQAASSSHAASTGTHPVQDTPHPYVVFFDRCMRLIDTARWCRAQGFDATAEGAIQDLKRLLYDSRELPHIVSRLSKRSLSQTMLSQPTSALPATKTQYSSMREKGNELTFDELTTSSVTRDSTLSVEVTVSPTEDRPLPGEPSAVPEYMPVCDLFDSSDFADFDMQGAQSL